MNLLLTVVLAAAVITDVWGCVPDGSRLYGEFGFPAVLYNHEGCCDGGPPGRRARDWGSLCGRGAGTSVGATSESRYKEGERNQGAPGRSWVNYNPCCDGSASVQKKGDWGWFCPPVRDRRTKRSHSSVFYDPGERNQGAPGRPHVDYKPCCDRGSAVEQPFSWGLVCPGESATFTEVTVDIVETPLPAPTPLSTPLPVLSPPGMRLPSPLPSPEAVPERYPVPLMGCNTLQDQLRSCRELVLLLDETPSELMGFNFYNLSKLEAKLREVLWLLF